MSETLIPTMSLRFVERAVPGETIENAIDHGRSDVLMRKIRVLQQMFERPNGKRIWVDVPLTDETGYSYTADLTAGDTEGQP